MSSQPQSAEHRSDSGVTADFAIDTQSKLNGRPDPANLLAVIPELRPYPDLAKKIAAAFETPQRRLDAVFTDIDNSFIPGTGRSEADLRAGLESATKLVDYVAQRSFVFIPVTGSSWDSDTSTTKSVRHRIETGEIPSFNHALVTDGGMVAVGRNAAGEYEIDSMYQDSLAVSKRNFHAEAVFEMATWVADRLNTPQFAEVEVGLTPLDFNRIVEVDPSSQPKRAYLQEHAHPDGKLVSPKVCFYFYANSIEERDIVERLFREELPSHSIICCEERDFNNLRDRSGGGPTKFCLDITPVHKGTPVEYFSALIKRTADVLHAQLGGPELSIVTWYFGDAANDLVAARRHEVSRVGMVGGANPEFTRHRGELAQTKRVYREPDASTRLGAASILHALQADPFYGEAAD